MDAPLWKLTRLKASGQQQVKAASEICAFSGFRWPEEGSAYLVDAEKSPEIFLVLDPFILKENNVAVARPYSDVPSTRVYEIFEMANSLLNQDQDSLHTARNKGLANISLSFYDHLKTRLSHHDPQGTIATSAPSYSRRLYCTSVRLS